MRILERPALDDAAWERLLHSSLELGISTVHASNEYESHDRFCGLVAKIGSRRFQYVVKLAEPHFGDVGFDRQRLVSKIDAYLQDFAIDRIDVLQWMWRGDLKDEPTRLRGFATAAPEIRDAFAELVRAGKVGAVAPFPYTIGFADVALDLDWCSGLTVYLNPLERELVPQIDRAADLDIGTIAIRPFAGGKALAGMTATECLRSVLAHRGVTTAVVSYSSQTHLEELVMGTTT